MKFFVALLLCAVDVPALASSRDVEIAGPLKGTITVPDGGIAVPAVLIVAGSGPTDRDGNQPGMLNDAYKKLAEGFSACGVATLRTDKRGIGMSESAETDESNLVVQTYVNDTVSWLDWLRHQPRIDSVSLLGHSEGALIASLAAQRTRVDKLIVIAGAGRRYGDILRAQLDTLDMAPPMRKRAGQMIALLERGETMDDPPKGLDRLFRASVQPYLISEFALDPVAEFRKTRAPALIVQGTTDLQIGVADARALAAARPDAKLETIDGMNHILRVAPAAAEANLETYTEPGRPLAPGLMPMLCAFIHK